MSVAKNFQKLSLGVPAAQNLQSDDEKLQIDDLPRQSSSVMQPQTRMRAKDQGDTIMAYLSHDEQCKILDAQRKEKWDKMQAEIFPEARLAESKPKETKEVKEAPEEVAGKQKETKEVKKVVKAHELLKGAVRTKCYDPIDGSNDWVCGTHLYLLTKPPSTS